MSKKFYVYTHRYASGPMEGKVFYVGKGCARRAWNRTHRSDLWKETAEKYGVTVGIVARFSSEQCALSLEAALIKKIGRKNLCNKTGGGAGCCKITDKNRSLKSRAFSRSMNPAYDASVYDFWHRKYGKITSTKLNLRMCFGVQSSGLARVCNGVSRSCGGWVLYANKDRPIGKSGPNSLTKKIRETYVHESGKEWTGNPFDFAAEFGLNKANVYKMRSGITTAYRGWRMAE